MRKPDHFSTPFKKVQRPILSTIKLSKGPLNATVSTVGEGFQQSFGTLPTLLTLLHSEGGGNQRLKYQ